MSLPVILSPTALSSVASNSPPSNGTQAQASPSRLELPSLASSSSRSISPVIQSPQYIKKFQFTLPIERVLREQEQARRELTKELPRELPGLCHKKIKQESRPDARCGWRTDESDVLETLLKKKRETQKTSSVYGKRVEPGRFGASSVTILSKEQARKRQEDIQASLKKHFNAAIPLK